MRFSISRQVLAITMESGVIHTVRGTSGRNACLNNPSLECQILGNEGPIPTGRYFIRPQELDDPWFLYDIARSALGDWGDFRVRLHPPVGTVPYGRDGFFLHGGQFPGSRGCIDIGGGITGSKKTNSIKQIIKSSRTQIELVVED